MAFSCSSRGLPTLPGTSGCSGKEDLDQLGTTECLRTQQISIAGCYGYSDVVKKLPLTGLKLQISPSVSSVWEPWLSLTNMWQAVVSEAVCYM